LIKCIVGLKGSGKTKQLINMVNDAVQEDSGSVICIEKDPKLTYDINHHCRLIDTVNYNIRGFDGFHGFLCGLYAQNYDITTIFIDSLYKITGSDNTDEAIEFFAWLEKFSNKTGIKFVITISADPETQPKQVMRYA
jgi:GTPase SAR1 family protein